jgi:hypothetical protein
MLPKLCPSRGGCDLGAGVAVCDLAGDRDAGGGGDGELGMIPADVPKAVRARGGFNVQWIDEIEREVKHDVSAFLTSVAEHVGDEARFLHLGMTSSDTCLAVQLQRASDILLKDMDRVLAALKNGRSSTGGRPRSGAATASTPSRPPSCVSASASHADRRDNSLVPVSWWGHRSGRFTEHQGPPIWRTCQRPVRIWRSPFEGVAQRPVWGNARHQLSCLSGA